MKACLLSLVLIASFPVLRGATVEQRLQELEARVSEMQVLLEQLNRKPLSRAPLSDPALARTYQIRTGDSYWSIARRHGLTVDDLERANPGINPRRLAIGRSIRLPGAPSTNASSSRSLAKTHRIRKGEVLGRIAKQYGISLNRLMQANPEVDPRRLRIGGTLTIPGPSFAATTPSVRIPPVETKSGLPEDPVPVPPVDDPTASAGNPYLKALESGPPVIGNTEPAPTPSEPEPGLSELELITLDEDTRFSKIASEHRTTVALLNKLNRRDLSPDQLIKAGSQLYIPSR